MLQRQASLLVIILVLSAKTLSQTPPSRLSDEQIKRQTRRQALGTSVLAQLGLNEVPPKSNITVVVPPEERAKFKLISQLVNFTTRERQPGSCQSTEFFAQTVSTFLGIRNGK